MIGNCINSISLDLTTQQELIEIINSLRPGTAAGYELSMTILKDYMDIIAGPLTHIMNLSISSGINVPDLIKIARVVHSFKSGDHRLFQNYRPIYNYILPIFSKLLERIVY